MLSKYTSFDASILVNSLTYLHLRVIAYTCQKVDARKNNFMTFPQENYTIMKEQFILITDIKDYRN